MLDSLIYVSSFIVLLSILVFIHEYGHYIVARMFSVKIEEFAIGFGKEICGFYNKKKERWKICMIPLGGYVKMFGDSSEASSTSQDIFKLPKKQKEQTFYFKPLYQRFLIVLAGPMANYLFAIMILFFFISFFGITSSSTKISTVEPNMPAHIAGLQSGDQIITIDGKKVTEFSDLQRIVHISPNIPLKFQIKRNEEIIETNITPIAKDSTDMFDNKIKIGLIGIRSTEVVYKDVSLIAALPLAIKESYNISALTLKALSQIISGKRSFDDLSGPVRIAQYSGQVTKKAFSTSDQGKLQLHLILWFMAMISINLGLVNLLPIPILDGGHLLFYIIEFITKKPLSIKVQNIIYKLSFSFLITLFIFITFNDIKLIFTPY